MDEVMVDIIKIQVKELGKGITQKRFAELQKILI